MFLKKLIIWCVKYIRQISSGHAYESVVIHLLRRVYPDSLDAATLTSYTRLP